MTFRPFGTEEINLVGDSGTPAIEGSGNIAIKLGESTSTATTKLYIGDSSIATGELANPSNTTVLNCGIITANSVYADNINVGGGGGGGGGGTLLIVPAGNYIDWQDTDGDSCVKITGEADKDFSLVQDGDKERLYIKSNGSSIFQSSDINPVATQSTLRLSTNYQLTVKYPLATNGKSCGLAFAVTDNAEVAGASIYHGREGVNSEGYLAFATKADGDTSDNYLYERMRITKEGHVGIGQENPTASTINSDLQSNSRVLAVGIVTCKEIYGSIAGDSSLTGNVTIDGALTVTGDITAFYSSSDIKLKDNITPIENPLAKVISISGNTFNWNEHSEFEGQGDTGVVAQEIESLGLPGIVKEQVSGHKSVQYHKLVPLLIEAIKELEGRVSLLEK